jgi:disulfide oxidoreductase YuzD
MNKYWLKDPELHDYAAATDYLELVFSIEETKAFVDSLNNAITIQKKAKDILRASGLHLLPKDDNDVRDTIKKINRGKKLSPVLLVKSGQKLIIADGYHRICAVYHVSEDMAISCRLV